MTRCQAASAIGEAGEFPRAVNVVPFPFCTPRTSLEAVNRSPSKALQGSCSGFQKELITAKIAKKSRKGRKEKRKGR